MKGSVFDLRLTELKGRTVPACLRSMLGWNQSRAVCFWVAFAEFSKDKCVHLLFSKAVLEA